MGSQGRWTSSKDRQLLEECSGQNQATPAPHTGHPSGHPRWLQECSGCLRHMAALTVSKHFHGMVSHSSIRSPQAHITITGTNGPVWTQRSLVLITLGNPSTPRTPSFHIWDQTLLEEHNHWILQIDVSQSHRWKIIQLLKAMAIPHVAHIDNPRVSRASNREYERSTILLHFWPSIGGSLQREWIRKVISDKLSPFLPVLGWEEILQDAHAMLLHTATPEAFSRHSNLCKDMVVLSPTRHHQNLCGRQSLECCPDPCLDGGPFISRSLNQAQSFPSRSQHICRSGGHSGTKSRGQSSERSRLCPTILGATQNPSSHSRRAHCCRRQYRGMVTQDDGQRQHCSQTPAM